MVIYFLDFFVKKYKCTGTTFKLDISVRSFSASAAIWRPFGGKIVFIHNILAARVLGTSRNS